MRFHIGHHFWGSGNIGDDWMLAGFFTALEACGAEATFRCCTPFDRGALERRFPHVEWLPYDPAVRRASIAGADAWLGLGDTPFQSDTGSWFLEHLEWERVCCAELGKRMWFLGVGANDRKAFTHPLTRAVAQAAERIWTRDESSAQWVSDVAGPARVVCGADLSHAFFASQSSRSTDTAQEPPDLALCLNFEERSAFDLDTLQHLVRSRNCVDWLIQEIRPLMWSEKTLLSLLDENVRSTVRVVEPDYAGDSPGSMLARWAPSRAAVTSRYHAATALAWLGVRIVAVTRNDKIRGLVDDLRTVSIEGLVSAASVEHALEAADRVPRAVLNERSARSQHMVRDWADAVGLAYPRRGT